MKRIIIVFGALLAAISVSAQDDISKQMEVTKAYTPKVGRAAKLPVEPRMVDTVQLRPEIGYTINPLAWQTVFETEKFRPATISVAPYEKRHPFYLRGGVGYPLQSTADLYFNPYMGHNSTFGLYFNHRGSYSKIKNELGVKSKAKEMLNGGGLYGSKHFRRYKLEGDLAYDNRMYNAYGVNPDLMITMVPVGGTTVKEFRGKNFKYGKVRGSIGFGDTFTNLDRFNIHAGLNAGFSHSGVPYSDFDFSPEQPLEDRSNASVSPGQADLDAWIRMGQMFRGKHGFEVGLYERGTIGLKDFSDYKSSTVTLNTLYVLSTDKFSMKAGLRFYYLYNKPFDQSDVYLAPHLEAMLNVAKGRFTPYLAVTSKATDGSLEALSRINPYVKMAAPTGRTYDLRLGFSGNVNSIFSYRIYGGASWLRDYSALCGYQSATYELTSDPNRMNMVHDPLVFIPVTKNGMLYTVGAELGLSNLGGFSTILSAAWNKYDLGWLKTGLPEYEAQLVLSYAAKDKFSVSAGAKLIGPREFLDMHRTQFSSGDLLSTAVENRYGTAVDVSLDVEVKLFNNFWVFAEGNNLAGQKLYPYNHYRGLGANVMLGIKTVF